MNQRFENIIIGFGLLFLAFIILYNSGESGNTFIASIIFILLLGLFFYLDSLKSFNPILFIGNIIGFCAVILIYIYRTDSETSYVIGSLLIIVGVIYISQGDKISKIKI